MVRTLRIVAGTITVLGVLLAGSLFVLSIVGGARMGSGMPGQFAIGGGAVLGILGLTLIPAYALQSLADRIERRQYERGELVLREDDRA